jgi:adenosylhomocysteine nucleosidase
MNEGMHNSGFVNMGGGVVNAGQIAAGTNARITNNTGAWQPSLSPQPSRARGIAVISIKAAEMKAVADVFGLARDRRTPNGQAIYAGTVDAAGGQVNLVATRTLEPGQRSIMPTLQNLRTHYNPALFVLVGIGGGISPTLSIGDVVIATRVIYYDLRRELADEVRRRGEERHAPTGVTHAVNSFFTDYEDPASLDSAGGRFRVYAGPLGSGEAVIMDAESQVRKFLLAYNEKALAVDMEAGGLTQFCHETPQPPGWLVVRGISDLADRAKSYAQQPFAAHNAAVTLQHLIPYLPAEAAV